MLIRGRVGVYELLTLSDEIREMVMNRTDARRIAQTAIADGRMVLLQHAGFDKAFRGITTVKEVLRATKE